MSAAASLEVRGVSVRFGGVQALQDVSLTLAPGRIVGLIGPNGAGKSTLLNCISGITRPTAGEVRLGDAVLGNLRPDQITGRGRGRVFQHPQVIAELSVLENLQVASHRSLGYSVLAEMVGTPAVRRAEERARAEAVAVATRIGLAGSLEMRTGALPYGHRKLLELGRVVLLVEHNMGLVRRLCDSAVVLDAGQVIAEGTPEAVLADPRVLMAYLGELPAEAAVDAHA
jgi:branched-chain amino acid transport system ATP-binding protein